ncbi:GNAT family N-acetyltransferase [Mucilaginibacter flavidus]|uniref:GNAT family N-acetyltransferase n=1 Tax=Mucilaginibacter flavidus TaxID=2949309 RepID=UPI002093C694|nr:GNAT family N-acetyltransferase [Mucilaginibacter flavidus]MCO5949669.1 GNAT family N-acetyltransferase [Mucilaginibacter flavidus]
MKIVELTAGHNYNYKEFILKGLKAHPDAFRISPVDEVNEPFPTTGNPYSFTLGAINDDNTLAGVVSFKTETANREKLMHKGLLFRMYVSAENAGKGVGRKLVEHLLARVRELDDIEQVNLTVVATNENAKRLYTTFGFEIFSFEKRAIKLKDTYLDENAMVLFTKPVL